MSVKRWGTFNGEGIKDLHTLNKGFPRLFKLE